MTRSLDSEDLEFTAEIRRSDADEYGVLRTFYVTIEARVADVLDPLSVGRAKGWICWDLDAETLIEAGDSISYDALVLAEAAAHILATHPFHNIRVLVLVDRMQLEPEWRGHRRSRSVIAGILDLFQLEPSEAVVVLTPEPQQSTPAGPYPDGPIRDAALARLRAAYRESGFEPWDGGTTWWLPIDRA